MNTSKHTCLNRGFTLMELMVAMAITSVIVTVLVSISSSAIDTWNRSRTELRASRQAKAMLDLMTNDLESLVTKKNAGSEWLSAEFKLPTGGGSAPTSSNASTMIFFTAATDRYDGQVGVASVDNGGDVSCVAYQLQWQDPVGSGNGNFDTFVLNRLLINPDEAFTGLLTKMNASTSLSALFQPFETRLIDSNNFVCENIFQFTVSFNIETIDSTGKIIPRTVTMRSDTEGAKSFRIMGDGIVILPDPNDTTLKTGRLTSVGISISILTDGAMNLLRKNNNFATDSDWLAKNTYHYSKQIELPSLR